MSKAPKDNLPLDGEVYKEGDVRVYIYSGYHCQDFNKCAVKVKGEPGGGTWVDRRLLRPVSEVE